MSGMFSKPQIQAPPPPPPPPDNSLEVKDAAEKERMTRLKAQGRASTIMTTGNETQSPSLQKLLGS